MQTFILQENVLSDNILQVADTGKRFKGNYIAVVHEYSYQNAWSDKLDTKRFKTKKSLFAYLSKRYPNFDTDMSNTAIY